MGGDHHKIAIPVLRVGIVTSVADGTSLGGSRLGAAVFSLALPVERQSAREVLPGEVLPRGARNYLGGLHHKFLFSTRVLVWSRGGPAAADFVRRPADNHA